MMLETDKYKYANLLLLVSLLFPTFPTYTRMGGGRLGDIALTLVILILLVLFIFIYNEKIRKKPFLIGLFIASIFILLISISLLQDSLFVSLRDVFEYHKPLLILLVFYFYASLSWSDQNLNNHFIKPLHFTFVFFIIYGIIEAFTGSFGDKLSTIIYKNNRPILYGKSTGSFGITYFFATFMLLSFLYFFFLYAIERRVKFIWFAFGSILMIIATQSRTLLISLAASFTYIFSTYWLYKKFPGKKSLYLSTGLVVLLVIIFWSTLMNKASEAFPYLYLGLEHLVNRGVDPEKAGSANERLRQLVWAWENQSTFPLLGAGISKTTGPMLESFYALYLYRYGFLGIFIAIGLLFYNYILSIRCYRLARRRNNSRAAAYFLAFSVFCVVLPISSLSSVITDQVRFTILYYGTMAIMINYYYQFKNSPLEAHA